MILGKSTTRSLCLSASLILCGCKEISPISGKMVNEDQLDFEWANYQKEHNAKYRSLQEDIDHTTMLGNIALKELENKKNTIGQLIDALGSSSAAGGTGILSAAIGAIGVGLHLNNLRYDRKIALPEKRSDDPGDADDEGDDGGDSMPPVPVTYADASSLATDLALQARKA